MPCLRPKSLRVGGDDFLVHAGDDLILSRDNRHVRRLTKVFEELSADATLLVQRVDDPRRYCVVEGVRVSKGIVRVKRIVEKPRVPRSNMATIAIYGVQALYGVGLIDGGGVVYAVELKEGKRIDVGTSEMYWNALNTTYEFKLTR